jgi:hypothetical protein
MNEDITKINQAKAEGGEAGIAKLEDIKDNFEIAMNWDMAKATEEAIAEIRNAGDQTKVVTAAEEISVIHAGGDITEANTRIAGIDAKVQAVEANAKQEIQAVENAGNAAGEIKETNISITNFDEAKNVAELQDYISRIQGENKKIAEKGNTEMKNIFDSCSNEELLECFNKTKNSESKLSRNERIQEMKENLQGFTEGYNHISGSAFKYIKNLAEQRQSPDLEKELEKSFETQEKNNKEVRQFERFQENILSEIGKVENSEIAKDSVRMSMEADAGTAASYANSLALAKKLNVISENDIQDGFKNYIGEKLKPTKEKADNGGQVNRFKEDLRIDVKILLKNAEQVFGNADFIKSELVREGILTEEEVKNFETKIEPAAVEQPAVETVTENSVPVPEVPKEQNASNVGTKLNLFPDFDFEKPEKVETKNESGEIQQKQEKIKEFDKEIKVLVDQALARLPDQLKQLYNSESYKKLIELNNKRAAEEQSLFEAYDKYTKNGDGSHRRISFDIGENEYSQVQYTADLEFHKAPKELIKRFQEYYNNFKRPAEKMKDEVDAKYNETINKDRWAYESALRSKSEEVFESDSSAAGNFENKVSDYYRSNFNRIKNEALPNQKIDVNTRGTLYSLSQSNG